MAKIPDVYRERVIPQPSMDVAQHEPGTLGRGLQQVGQSISQIEGMARKEQQRLDDARADDAINKLRQKQLDLTIGQPTPGKDAQGGYANLRGASWVNPGEEGEVPLDQYRTRFYTERDAIAKKSELSGRALTRYNDFAANADLDFQAGLLRHALRESDSYYKQTYDSTVRSEALTAGANWDNPAAVAGALRRVDDATAREAERTGGVDVEAAQQETRAGVIEAVVESALREGDSKSAEEYLNEYKDNMPAKTALSLYDKVQSVRKHQVALEATDKVVQQLTPRMMPSPYDRVEALASGADTPGEWKLPAHAVKEAAKLAGMPVDQALADGSPEYNAELGKAYFKNMMQKYGGDREKAWAAYQAGPKVVDTAEKAAKKEGGNWLNFVPKETRDHVVSNRKAYDVGAGAPEPTLMEVKEMTRRQVLEDNPTATGDQIDAAQTKAEQWFNDLRVTRNQTQDNALLDVQQRVDAGKIRSYSDLTPQDLALLGSKRTSARSYIEGAEGDQDKMTQASPAAREQYDRLMSSPDVLAKYDAATIMSLTPELGKKWVDDLLRRKQDYLTNPEKFTAARVDADLFEATVEPFLKGVSRSAAALRKHEIRQRVEAEIGQRRASGETGTSIDRDKVNIILKYAMNYPVEKPGMIWGMNVEQVPGVKFSDVEQIPLAPEKAAEIRAALAKRGYRDASDAVVLQVYRKMRAAEAAK